MKRSIVFLTPASADKKGELVELEYEDGPVQFLEPVSAENLAEGDITSQELGKLRAAVTDAQTALRHAKSKGAGAATITKLQKAVEAARAAVGKHHYDRQQERGRQKTGGDSPFSRQSEDTRMFMPVRDYSVNDDDPNDTTGRTFDDDANDELEAQVLALVHALEQAMSNGAPQSKIEKLQAAIKVLREQFYYPGNQPAAAPPRKSHIDQNPGGEADTGAITGPFPGEKKLPDSGPAWKSRQAAAPAVKTKTGWDKFLADLDDRLAKKALAALHPGGASSPATHRARNALALNWNTFLRDPSLRPV